MQLARTVLWGLFSLTYFVLSATGNNSVQNKLIYEASRNTDGVVELNDSNYDAFLAAPRDFSVTVLYTAMSSRFHCTACHMFDPSYKETALGWRKKKSSKKHVFAIVEAERSMDVIRKVSRHLTKASVYARTCDYDVSFSLRQFGWRAH